MLADFLLDTATVTLPICPHRELPYLCTDRRDTHEPLGPHNGVVGELNDCRLLCDREDGIQFGYGQALKATNAGAETTHDRSESRVRPT